MFKSDFLKSTVVGGIMFLLPVVVLMLILGKAYQFSMKIAAPIDAMIPIERFAGVALVNVLAILVIVLVCYLAGLAARLPWLKAKAEALEERLIATVPPYAFAKTMISGVVNAKDEVGRMTPVLVALDDYQQIAFEVERTPGGKVVVFLPGSPNPWSGTVVYMTADRVEALDMAPQDAIKNIRVLGRGSEKIPSAGL